MQEQLINPDTPYQISFVTDKLELASKATLARWRMEKIGIPYVKSGNRIFYLGRDLIDYIEQNRVEVTSHRTQN